MTNFKYLLAIFILCLFSTGNCAKCYLQPIGESQRSGVVTFALSNNKTLPFDPVEVTFDFPDYIGDGEPKEHAVHVHQYGDVSDETNGLAVKGHYNPFNGVQNCDLNSLTREVGDMGNIIIKPDGVVGDTKTITGMQLSGYYSIIGRSVVLHEKASDCSDPTVSTGKRIAQCVIAFEDSLSESFGLDTPYHSIPSATCYYKVDDSHYIRFLFSEDPEGKVYVRDFSHVEKTPSYWYAFANETTSNMSIAEPGKISKDGNWSSSIKDVLVGKSLSISKNNILGKLLLIGKDSEDKAIGACVIGHADPASFVSTTGTTRTTGESTTGDSTTGGATTGSPAVVSTSTSTTSRPLNPEVEKSDYSGGIVLAIIVASFIVVALCYITFVKRRTSQSSNRFRQVIDE